MVLLGLTASITINIVSVMSDIQTIKYRSFQFSNSNKPDRSTEKYWILRNDGDSRSNTKIRS